MYRERICLDTPTPVFYILVISVEILSNVLALDNRMAVNVNVI